MMHNGLLADPTYPFTMAIKKITNKGSKKMTESDHEQRNRLEWEGGLYWDETIGPYAPTDNIERCIQSGAQKSRLGKDVQASVFVQDLIVKLDYKGPRDKDGLYADTDHVLRRGVVINGNRIIRVRPMFREWSITFTLEYDETIINEKSLITAMQDAGALIGFSDWRPKFGRFTLEIL